MIFQTIKEAALDFWHIAHKGSVFRFFHNLKDRYYHRGTIIEPELSQVVSSLSVTDRAGWGLERLGVKQAWSVSHGEGVKIAVLDTGIALKHQDFRGAIADAVDMTTDRNANDQNGHGSHVAGIIGARADGHGMVGVAPMVKLYSAKVLNSRGKGNFEWIAAGIRWAIRNDVDIINMSLGASVPYGKMHSAIQQAVANGIVVIAAAGNSGYRGSVNTMGWPGRYPEVISVGSIDLNMKRSRFSSVGKEIDIMAPGGKIYSCWPPNRYSILSGTSMASPFVAGLCALIIGKHKKRQGSTPVHDYKDMLEHLKHISVDMDSPGWDRMTGWGLVNAGRIREL